jgi:hypothetical protein
MRTVCPSLESLRADDNVKLFQYCCLSCHPSVMYTSNESPALRQFRLPVKCRIRFSPYYNQQCPAQEAEIYRHVEVRISLSQIGDLFFFFICAVLSFRSPHSVFIFCFWRLNPSYSRRRYTGNAVRFQAYLCAFHSSPPLRGRRSDICKELAAVSTIVGFCFIGIYMSLLKEYYLR